MKYEKGPFRVVRRCCTSRCVDCRSVPAAARPVLVEQGSGYSREYADFVAKNWARYEARVEPLV